MAAITCDRPGTGKRASCLFFDRRLQLRLTGIKREGAQSSHLVEEFMNTLKMHVVSKGAAAPPKRLVHTMALFAAIMQGLCAAFPSHAIDLVAFGGITGPLVSALTQLAALAPGVKALVGFIGFVVALISLAALRNFGPVLFYIGLAIFAAVGLVIAGAIMGAVV